jgi:hypothetical protein
MKILIMCPGSFTAKLNSAERGEGRWAQNFALMLAKAGHDVYAASGSPSAETDNDRGVKLINQALVHMWGPYDLYIDAAWWENKKLTTTAKKYVALKWSPENYMYNPFPDNFYLAYPYVSHNYNFSRPNFPNRDKAFALPTYFGDDFKKPNWDKSSIFLPGKIDTNRPYKQYSEVITKFLKEHPVEGRSVDFFRKEYGDEAINYRRPDSNWQATTSYDKVLESLSKSKLSLPILNPGCIIEAAFQGVPSVFWGHGGFFNNLSDSMNLTIQHDAPPERFTEVVDLMMNNKKKYTETVLATQDYFVSHTYTGALKYFNFMIENIF